MQRLCLPLLLFAAAFPLPARALACVLPPMDGGEVDWSPPSIDGRLKKVQGKRLVVLAESGSSYSIIVEPATGISTVYGGGIDMGQLEAGQYVSIWLAGCKKPAKAFNRAAVLKICSLSAEPCLK